MKLRYFTWSPFLAVLSLFSAVSLVFAHGEDKPGPHEGIIRMPVGFHVEVVPIDMSSFKVYLLDINFAHPLTERSSVTAKINSGSSDTNATCSVKEDYFLCLLSSGGTLENGVLVINAVRDGAKGIEAKYELPLSLSSNGRTHHEAKSNAR